MIRRKVKLYYLVSNLLAFFLVRRQRSAARSPMPMGKREKGIMMSPTVERTG